MNDYLTLACYTGVPAVILRQAGWTPHPLTRGLSVNGFVRNLPCRRADRRCLACGHLLALSVNVCWRRLAAVDRLGMLGAGLFDVAQVLLQDAKVEHGFGATAFGCAYDRR
jgi:hypothetical protein